MNESAIINTDGACSGNPGPGGFAAIIEVGECRITVTGGDPATTNNRMELSAVIEALRVINSQSDLQHSHVTVRSDSQYIVKAFNENWIETWKQKNWRTAKRQPVANRDLWEALLTEIAPHRAEFVWVKGHSGDPMNEECDRLAVMQAQHAPSENAYWVSTGNPRTQEPRPQEIPTQQHLSIMELALERNQIAHRALQEAIDVHNASKDTTPPVTGELKTALRHLSAQKDILWNIPTSIPAEDPVHNFPLTLAVAQDQNHKALQAMQRTNLVLQERLDPAFILQEMTDAADILSSQHRTLENAINESKNCQDNTAGDTDLLMEQTAQAIEDALKSIIQGQTWKTANTLELALQRLNLHRKLRDQQATASTCSGNNLPRP